MAPTGIELLGTALFAAAVVHGFLCGTIERLVRSWLGRRPPPTGSSADRGNGPRVPGDGSGRGEHAGRSTWVALLWEVEVVLAFWALLFLAAMGVAEGPPAVLQYLLACDFTAPFFLVVILLVAATRPILDTLLAGVLLLVRGLPLPRGLGFPVVVLALIPLLGSLITEPAAMTLGALLLAEHVFVRRPSTRLQYAMLAVLLVNVSIGGALTPFAAAPVLMVAAGWHWDLAFLLQAIGWKAALAVLVNALGLALLFRRELVQLAATGEPGGAVVPRPLVLVHVAVLAGVVLSARDPGLLIALLLLFLGVALVTRGQQDRLILREALLVGGFLAGLVVLGAPQRWWLQPALTHLGPDQVFVGAGVLTAFVDNAALTYLGSLTDSFSGGLPGTLASDLTGRLRYALVTGAITGGGLTILANAPNPAGIALLRRYFAGATVRPLALLLAALPPTLVAALAFRFL